MLQVYWDIFRGWPQLLESLLLAWILHYDGNCEVLAENSYNIAAVNITLKNKLHINWISTQADTVRDSWHYTHLTIQVKGTYRSVRYPIDRHIYFADYDYYLSDLHSGREYQVSVRYVGKDYQPISNLISAEFVLPPKQPENFSAALDYHNLTINGQPEYIAFYYSIQRKSYYDGHRIKCGKRNNGILNVVFNEYYKYRYRSAQAENIALHKSTNQSSTTVLMNGFKLESSHAVNSLVGLNTNTATTGATGAKWWMVDLGQVYNVQLLLVYPDQTVCGDQYCNRLLRRVTIFTRIYTHTSEACEPSIDNIARSFKAQFYRMVEAKHFNPPIIARYIIICADLADGIRLSLAEVKVYEEEQPISVEQLIKIDHSVFPPGTAIDCDIYSIVKISNKEVSSGPKRLAKQVLTVPLPPRDVIFTLTDGGQYVIRFSFISESLRLYSSFRVHFIIAGKLFSLENALEYYYEGPLVPGRKYVVHSWISVPGLVGRVRSYQNYTSEFTAEGFSSNTTIAQIETHPQTTERDTEKGPKSLHIVLYVLGACTLLIVCITMTVITYRCLKLKKLQENRISPNNTAMVQALEPDKTYSIILPTYDSLVFYSTLDSHIKKKIRKLSKTK